MHQIGDNQLSETIDLLTVIQSGMEWNGMVLLLVGMIGRVFNYGLDLGLANMVLFASLESSRESSI